MDAPRNRVVGRVIAWLLCAAATGVGGCAPVQDYFANGFKVGPSYLKPDAPVKPEWIDAADKRVASEPSDMSHWWSMFNDPVLNGLVDEVAQQNLTLREAGFRVLQARAQRNIAVGNLFPQSQTMDGGYSRNELSKRNANTSFIPQRFYSQHQVGFNLSWELDFWGRFRRSVESAEATLDASVEDFDAVLVTLQGDVAEAYVQYRTIEKQLRLVRENVKLQQQTLELTQARAKAGLTTELDLAQAQSNVSQTRALIPQFEAEQRIVANQLCVLLGIPPVDLDTKLGKGVIPVAPERIAVGIPADLLSRRPDVRRAERQAASQCAQIGVATAELFPRIMINGTIGTSAASFGDLLHDQSMFGNVGPAFSWKILNYGRLKNNVLLQDARFQELVAAYQQSVLKAEQEAENGLVRFLKAQQRSDELEVSVQASEKAVRIALTQYKGGLVDFNRIALLQLNLVQQQDLLAQAQGNIAIGLIDLFRALGGGWEYRLQENVAGIPEAGAPEAVPAAPANPVLPAAPVVPRVGPAAAIRRNTSVQQAAATNQEFPARQTVRSLSPTAFPPAWGTTRE